MQQYFLNGGTDTLIVPLTNAVRSATLAKYDKETTTQYDIDRRVANIIVGFASLKPAEFVVIQIQQVASWATL